MGNLLPRKTRFFAILSLLLFFFSVFLGALLGPRYFMALGLTGACLGLINGLGSLPKNSRLLRTRLAWVAFILNLASALVGKGLDIVFIHPFKGDMAPAHLDKTYRDPSRYFEIKVPKVWKVEPTSSGSTGFGAVMKPGPDEPGLAEVRVLVYPLQKTIREPAEQLAALTRWLKDVEKTSTQRHEISVAPKEAKFLDGSRGLRLEVEAKKLWIPARQVGFYGLKNKKFLCMVAGTGLSAYMERYATLLNQLFVSLKPEEFEEEP